MSNNFVKGALLLTVATFLSKFLGSVFRIPLQNIAGDEVLGIFTLVYPVYMAVLIISVAGIPIAISKLISEARVRNDVTAIRDIFVTSGILAFSFGVVSFSFMYIFAEYISLALGGLYAKPSIIIVAITLLVAPYMAVYRGFFQGFEIMKQTAFSQVLEQFVRVGLILIIAYILVGQQSTNDIVAAGVMVGSSIGAFASLIYLRLSLQKTGLKPIAAQKYNFKAFKSWSKKILLLSIPICVGALTMALLNFVDSVTIPSQLKNIGYIESEVTYLYGIYGRGLALVQIAVVFASALILPLIPHITRSLSKGDINATKTTIEKAMKFTNLTSWPAGLGLVALIIPINLALFTNTEGSIVLAIICASALFTAISILTTGILQGINRSNQAAYIVLASSIIKVILNLILVEKFGLTGAAISTLITYLILCGLNLYMINKHIRFTIFQRETAVHAFSSIIMGIIVGTPLLVLWSENWTRLVALSYVMVMLAIGAVIYVSLVLLLKGISKQELLTLPLVGGFIAKRMRG